MTAYRILDTLEHRRYSLSLSSINISELSFGIIGRIYDLHYLAFRVVPNVPKSVQMHCL